MVAVAMRELLDLAQAARQGGAEAANTEPLSAKEES